MKKLVISAVALSLAGTTAAANGDDWATLDQEVDALASSLNLEGENGPSIGGYIIVDYSSSGDITVGDGDLGGFSVPNARIHATGKQGVFSYKVQADFQSSTLLKDGYVKFNLGGEGSSAVNGQLGQFKAPVARNGLLSASNLFFRNRTASGEVWASRQAGAMFSGAFDIIDWALAIQNGTDGAADDYLISARLSANVFGEGLGSVEGAAGADDSPSGAIGLAFYDDGAVDDGSGFLADFNVAASTYSFGVEFHSIGEGAAGVSNFGKSSTFGPNGLESDTSPISIQGTYMFSPDTAEVGIRFQDLDNTAGGEVIEFGVNRYWAGHKAKAGIFYEDYTDDADGDVTVLGIRTVAGF
jgi:hypothetical protein